MLNKLFSTFFYFFYNGWSFWWLGSMKRTLPSQNLNEHLEPHAPKMLPYITTFSITSYPRISVFLIPLTIINNPTYFTKIFLLLSFFARRKLFLKESSGIFLFRENSWILFRWPSKSFIFVVNFLIVQLFQSLYKQTSVTHHGLLFLSHSFSCTIP